MDEAVAARIVSNPGPVSEEALGLLARARDELTRLDFDLGLEIGEYLRRHGR